MSEGRCNTDNPMAGPRKQRAYSATERRELWQRWREGESQSDIARSLGRKPGSVQGVLVATGGIEPPPRRRAPRALRLEEREEISRRLACGEGVRAIARALRRPPSTVSREVNRNGGPRHYRAAQADNRAWEQARRPKPCKLATQGRLRRIVAAKLAKNWSPEQISGWLRWKYPGDERMQISHETIYLTLFVQARGALKRELQAHLRSGRILRRSRKATLSGQSRGQIIDAVSIRDRPAEAEDRAVPGHWEGDLVFGSGRTQIATLVERHSRLTMLVALEGRDAASVANGLVRQIQKLPVELRRSLTWDRGLELAKHKDITLATTMRIFFCDPRSPWQRGSNENTNGLLRQYFPKTKPIEHSQAELNKVARELNSRPRKTLGFRTPAAVLAEALR